MTIRAVIWDMGGVVLRTFDRSARERWEQRLGLEMGQLDRLVFFSEIGQQAALGRATVDEVWNSVLSRLGLPQSRREEFERDFFAGDRVDEALMAYIRGLRPLRKTGMITNAWMNVRHWLEKEWRIADAFDTLVVSAEEGLLKPDARIYRMALERLHVAPEKAVFVDDFEENVDGARAVGMQAVHFRNPEQAMSDLDSLLVDHS